MIDSFTGDYRFLSNFYEYPGYYLGNNVFPTAEHAYQWCKATNVADRTAILQASSPGRAKQIGNQIECRDDWDLVKVYFMYKIVRRKFDGDLQQRLLDTGFAHIVEGNTWGDEFWGVCKGKGMNVLGKILMQVRKDLREWETRMVLFDF